MNAATNIVKKYGLKQCEACVTALCLKLSGLVLVIDVRYLTHTRPFIIHKTLFPDSAISDTGLHYGFLIEGIVYDNLHHSGIKKNEWLSNFLFFNPRIGREAVITNEQVKEITSQQFLSRKK